MDSNATFNFKNFVKNCGEKCKRAADDLVKLENAWADGSSDEIKKYATNVQRKLTTNNVRDPHLQSVLNEMKSGVRAPPKKQRLHVGKKKKSPSPAAAGAGRGSGAGQSPSQQNFAVEGHTLGSRDSTSLSAGSSGAKPSPADSATGPLHRVKGISMEIKAFKTLLKDSRDAVKKGKLEIEDPDVDSETFFESHQHLNEILGEWQEALSKNEECETLLEDHSSWMLETLEALIKFPEKDDFPKPPDVSKVRQNIPNQVEKSFALAGRLAEEMRKVRGKSTDVESKPGPADAKKKPLKYTDKEVQQLVKISDDVKDNHPSINNKIVELLAFVGTKPKHKNADNLKKTDENLDLVTAALGRMKTEIDESMASLKKMEERLKAKPKNRNPRETLPDIIKRIDESVLETVQSNRNWEAYSDGTTATLEECQIILANLLSSNDIKGRAQTPNRTREKPAAKQLKYILSNAKTDVEAEFTRLKDHIELCRRREQSLQEHCNELQQGNETLIAEADSLRLRLSEIAGAKLTENNPNVADLSDPNRPTKLAEKYSELYDNQWTDAFHALTETQALSERAAIDVLLEVLQRAYNYSSEAAQAQDLGIKFALMYPVKVSDNVSSPGKDMKMSIVHRKVVTDLRKQTAKTAAMNMRKDFFAEISKKIKRPGEENKELDLKAKHCWEYAEACLVLCFHMCVQSPPVYIDTGDLKSRTKFHKKIYREYTQSGKYIDFVVWPLLQLQEGGDTLLKGVAQGCS